MHFHLRAGQWMFLLSVFMNFFDKKKHERRYMHPIQNEDCTAGKNGSLVCALVMFQCIYSQKANKPAKGISIW